MVFRAVTTLVLLGAAAAHDADMPVNPVLGVPGFPDCWRANPSQAMTVDEAAMDLVCKQKNTGHHAGAIKIGCIGPC